MVRACTAVQPVQHAHGTYGAEAMQQIRRGELLVGSRPGLLDVLEQSCLPVPNRMTVQGHCTQDCGHPRMHRPCSSHGKVSPGKQPM